jgi:hypothetical protein
MELLMPQTPFLQSRAAAILRQNHIPALRKLSAEETDEVVILQGCVSSYYLKQLAQESLMPILGGRQLINRVLVVRPQETVESAP